MTKAHAAMVVITPENKNHPFRATCVCGWKSGPWATRRLADAVGTSHVLTWTGAC
jgi:hypothetical protein